MTRHMSRSVPDSAQPTATPSEDVQRAGALPRLAVRLHVLAPGLLRQGDTSAWALPTLDGVVRSLLLRHHEVFTAANKICDFPGTMWDREAVTSGPVGVRDPGIAEHALVLVTRPTSPFPLRSYASAVRLARLSVRRGTRSNLFGDPCCRTARSERPREEADIALQTKGLEDFGETRDFFRACQACRLWA